VLGNFEELEYYFENSNAADWDKLTAGMWQGRCFSNGDDSGFGVEHIFAERNNGPLVNPTKMIYRRFENEPWTPEVLQNELESESYRIRSFEGNIVVKGVTKDSRIYFCSLGCVKIGDVDCK